MDEKQSIAIKLRGGRRPGAGRPKGAPNKLTRDIKVLASQYGPEALQTLVLIMNQGDSEQARIAAAKELLDRAYGKPTQQMQMTPNGGLTVIVDRSCNGRVPVPLPALVDQATDDREQ